MSVRRNITGAATSLALAVALTACGNGSTDAAGCGPTEASRVAGDPAATAAEVIACGLIGAVQVSGDRRLVTFHVPAEDDELPSQDGWRLYDEDGATIAEAKQGKPALERALAEVHPLPDGFLLAGPKGLTRLDRDGAEHPVRVSSGTAPIPSGAVLVGGDAMGAPPSTWYDPATDRAAGVPQPPFQAQRMVLDDAGVVWAIKGWRGDTVHLATSPGGAGPWRSSNLRIKRGSSVGSLAAEDGEVLLTTVEAPPGEGAVDGLHTHASGHARAGWTTHVLTGVTGRTLDTMPHRVDGVLVLEAPYAGIFARTHGRFRPVDLPESTRLADGAVDAGMLRITSTGIYWSRLGGGQLWHADRLGSDWTRTPR